MADCTELSKIRGLLRSSPSQLNLSILFAIVNPIFRFSRLSG